MSAGLKRIAAIDGLRAIAVLSVIFYHLWPPLLPGGFIGVDVFFVISGYVVCKSLLGSTGDSFSQYIFGFYVRRLVRIYPALLISIITTLILTRMFIPEAYWFVHIPQTGFYALFGLSNLKLVHSAGGYFDVQAELNPFTHTWSLGVEEQFYLIFPLLLFAYHRCRDSEKRSVRHVGLGLLPVLFGLSLAWAGWETSRDPDLAYYLLPSRFWELAVGSMLCLLHERSSALPRDAAQALMFTAAGLAAVAAGLYFTVQARFPFPWAVAPVAGTALCIAGVVTESHHILSRLLSFRLVSYIGRISYSLYLWHWPVIVLLKWTIGLVTIVHVTLALVLIGLLGVLSYHFIERPFQRLPIYRDHSIQLSLSDDRGISVSGPRPLAISTNGPLVLLGLALIASTGYVYHRLERTSRLPLSVTEPPADPGKPDIWRPKFITATPEEEQSRRGCLEWANRRLFLVGDSHAFGYIEMAAKLRREKGVGIDSSWDGGIRVCHLTRLQRPADRAQQELALAMIRAKAKPGDVVLLASMRAMRLCTDWRLMDPAQVLLESKSEATEKVRQAAVLEAIPFLRELIERKLVVVIAAPTPVMPSPPFRVSDWFNRMNPMGSRGLDVDRHFLLDLFAPVWRSIRDVQRLFPEVKVWDPFSTLCPDATCHAFDGDKPLFFDGDHITGYANEKLYSDFLRFLTPIWGTGGDRAGLIEPESPELQPASSKNDPPSGGREPTG